MILLRVLTGRCDAAILAHRTQWRKDPRACRPIASATIYGHGPRSPLLTRTVQFRLQARQAAIVGARGRRRTAQGAPFRQPRLTRLAGITVCRRSVAESVLIDFGDLN